MGMEFFFEFSIFLKFTDYLLRQLGVRSYSHQNGSPVSIFLRIFLYFYRQYRNMNLVSRNAYTVLRHHNDNHRYDVSKNAKRFSGKLSAIQENRNLLFYIFPRNLFKFLRNSIWIKIYMLLLTS